MMIKVWDASQNLTFEEEKQKNASKKSRTMSQAMWMREGQGQFGNKIQIIHWKVVSFIH